MKKFLERITPYKLISHTKMSIVFATGRSTYYIAWTNSGLKAFQVSKVYARSCETPNELCAGPNYENIVKNLWLLTNKQTMILRNTHQTLKKIKKNRKRNFEDEASNIELEDTRRSNLNSCVKRAWFLYLFLLCSITLPVKVRFDIAVWRRCN